MTPYLRKEICKECGEPHWFRFWVGENCLKSREGLNVCDFDLPIHRFKRVNQSGFVVRDVEHMMILEIKTQNEALRGNQRDTLSVFNALLNGIVPVDGAPIGVESRPGYIIPGEKKIVWHGVHLVRVPAKRNNIGPFYFDNQEIDSNTLKQVINLDRDPNDTGEWGWLDIDRRHKAPRKADPCLYG